MVRQLWLLILTVVCPVDPTSSVIWAPFATGVVLDEIPWHLLPPGTVQLSVVNNNLHNIGTVPKNNSVEFFRAGGNLLTEFPDVRNMRHTLKSLILNRNPITKIEPPYLLADLHRLEELFMVRCPVVALPDIEYFPASIHVLKLDHTHLSTLPNVCQVNVSAKASGGLTIKHSGVSYVCDRSMVWAKMAGELGIFDLDSSDVTCRDPEHLRGRPWTGVSRAELLRTDEDPQAVTHSAVFRRLDVINFHCYPRVTRVLPAHVPIVDCASKCITADDCLLFAVDDGRCVLTSYVDGIYGTRADFTAHEEWYIVR